MSPRLEALLGLLADGDLHSGAALATRLEVSRSAVWKLVGELRALGIEVESQPRRGYRLPVAVELLDPAQILAGAAQDGRLLRADLEVLFETGSTNDWLYDAPAPAPGRPRVAFAELQRAGRGRRGRSWVAPFGSGLTFSVAWTFAETPADLPALGLAVGVAVAEALQDVGYASVGLKWPNDLVWRQRKLGGLLLQVRAEAGGGASIVAGLGLNLRLPAAARIALEAPGVLAATDLHEIRPGGTVGRNRLAATLVAAILRVLEEFGTAGFAAFASRWQRLDALAGQPVQVSQGADHISGRALGVADDGALLVEVAGRRQRFHSGDVSLRPATGGTAP
jgi:BirA family biotin operon repressor/biotin-[acetyl-CoA-carboxylase] ligase